MQACRKLTKLQTKNTAIWLPAMGGLPSATMAASKSFAKNTLFRTNSTMLINMPPTKPPRITRPQLMPPIR
jgi:hypothetical protein